MIEISKVSNLLEENFKYIYIFFIIYLTIFDTYSTLTFTQTGEDIHYRTKTPQHKTLLQYFKQNNELFRYIYTQYFYNDIMAH